MFNKISKFQRYFFNVKSFRPFCFKNKHETTEIQLNNEEKEDFKRKIFEQSDHHPIIKDIMSRVETSSFPDDLFFPEFDSKFAEIVKEHMSNISNTGYENENDLKYKFDTLDELVKHQAQFSELFKQIEVQPNYFPEIEDSLVEPSSELTQDGIFRSLSKLLKTKKVRERGSDYLIDLLLFLYYYVCPKEANHFKISYDSYANKIEKELKGVPNEVQQVFNLREVRDSLNTIFIFLFDLKMESLQKLSNLLIKIGYSNEQNWAKILKQYIIVMTLLKFKLRNSDFNHINIFMSKIHQIPRTKVLSPLIQKVCNTTLSFFSENSEQITDNTIIKTINSISKLSLLNAENSQALEKIIIQNIDNFEGYSITNLYFCFCKNKVGSPEFYEVIEQKLSKIINDKTQETFPLLVTTTAKGIQANFRENYELLKLIENGVIDNINLFSFQHLAYICNTFRYLKYSASPSFYKVTSEFFENFDAADKLTEYMCFQLLNSFLADKQYEFDSKKYFEKYCKYMTSKKAPIHKAKILLSQLFKRQNIPYIEQFKKYVN